MFVGACSCLPALHNLTSHGRTECSHAERSRTLRPSSAVVPSKFCGRLPHVRMLGLDMACICICVLGHHFSVENY